MAHVVEDVRFAGEVEGGRLRFLVASSSEAGKDHEFIVGGDGSRPYCSCKSYTGHRGYCTLTRNADEIVRTYWVRQFRSLEPRDLRMLDSLMTARIATFTRTDWIKYDTLAEIISEL